MDETTLLKFDKWIDYGKSHPRVNNFPRKGRGMDHVNIFVMKPRFLNFANASPW